MSEARYGIDFVDTAMDRKFHGGGVLRLRQDPNARPRWTRRCQGAHIGARLGKGEGNPEYSGSVSSGRVPVEPDARRKKRRVAAKRAQSGSDTDGGASVPVRGGKKEGARDASWAACARWAARERGNGLDPDEKKRGARRWPAWAEAEGAELG